MVMCHILTFSLSFNSNLTVVHHYDHVLSIDNRLTLQSTVYWVLACRFDHTAPGFTLHLPQTKKPPEFSLVYLKFAVMST